MTDLDNRSFRIEKCDFDELPEEIKAKEIRDPDDWNSYLVFSSDLEHKTLTGRVKVQFQLHYLPTETIVRKIKEIQ